ncbi:unnamed protein product [Danaus chrysippus]|uniref:(African queen) hypothetical protein n=1 Tax=Danaus chrysippus TaxID=151541 RepID=A0A8J2WBA7_9NEOP|nr:unnamed protein product [Danaus chrysippus]
MADTVPVCDVLSEAMEYLSKLGSNLRVRSENLKEKRLKKEKLKNSHALQKAASKVLLICELSKKSIENVETGVKKVLTRIAANQSNVSDGGKIASRKSSFVDNDVKYEYFDYKSRKLKIKQKVNLDHYMSVKVLTKPLPMDMQERYPVYHDCELYRNRKKQMCNSENNNKDSSETKELDSNINVEGNSSNTDISNQDKENHSENTEIIDDVRKRRLSKTKGSKSTKTKKFKNIKVISDSSGSDTEKENKNENDVAATQTSIECDTYNKETSNDEANTGDITSTVIPDPGSTEQNKYEGNELDTNLTIPKENYNTESNVTLNENENKQNESDVEEIPVTSIDSNINSNENTENVPSSNDVNCSKTGDQREEEMSVDKTDEIKNNDSQSSTNKPFIKCVNINKLLKDDKKAFPTKNDKEDNIIQKNKQKDNRNRRKSNNLKGFDQNKRKPLKEGQKHQSGDSAKKNDDDEYWRVKRSEVEKFKPKDFHINMMRLPEFTQDYLTSNGLKRITQNGNTVLEFTKETEKSISKDVLNVKSSLLNDSDSESEENLQNLAENLKKDLNKTNKDDGNPDSNEVDVSQSNQCDESIENTESNNLEDRSKTPDDTVSNKNDSTIVAQDEVKSSLLNDSTDESSPNKKRKRHSNSVSLPSKRKHMMESIHAKKMLLTYSSSSDTEDESLTGTLKKIRDFLLTGNSSGDEKNKDKNENESSESSSISLNKRKRSRSKIEENVKDKDISDSESKKTSSHTDDNEDVSCSSSKKVRRE